MKCYYAHDKKMGKVLIPGCWCAVNNCIEDISECYCRKALKKKEITREEYENAKDIVIEYEKRHIEEK